MHCIRTFNKYSNLIIKHTTTINTSYIQSWISVGNKIWRVRQNDTIPQMKKRHLCARGPRRGLAVAKDESLFVLWVLVFSKMSVRITLKAYLKILLHCHKYPYRAINGVLIGKAKQKVALDCIPLFHQSLQLSPMIEIALLQVIILLDF